MSFTKGSSYLGYGTLWRFCLFPVMTCGLLATEGCSDFKHFYRGSEKKCKDAACNAPGSANQSASQALTIPEDLPLEFDFWHDATLQQAPSPDKDSVVASIRLNPVTLLQNVLNGIKGDLAAAQKIPANSQSSQEQCLLKQLSQPPAVQDDSSWSYSSKNYGGCLDATKMPTPQNGWQTKGFAAAFRLAVKGGTTPPPATAWEVAERWPLRALPSDTAGLEALSSSLQPSSATSRTVALAFEKVTFSIIAATSTDSAATNHAEKIKSWTVYGAGTSKQPQLTATIDWGPAVASDPVPTGRAVTLNGPFTVMEGAQKTSTGTENRTPAKRGIATEYYFADFRMVFSAEGTDPQEFLGFSPAAFKQAILSGSYIVAVNGIPYELAAQNAPCLLQVSALVSPAGGGDWQRQGLGQISLCATP